MEIKSGTTNLYISNDGFVNSAMTIEIDSAILLKTKTSTISATTFYERYFTLTIEVVTNKSDEDLPNNKYYLPTGQHQLTLTQGDKLYTDLLFLEFEPLNDKKYTQTRKTRVYKKQ